MTEDKKKPLTPEEIEAIIKAVTEVTGRVGVLITPDMTDEDIKEAISSELEAPAGELCSPVKRRKKENKELLH